MPNNARVTLACFLAYFVMSGMLAPIGIIMPVLADFLSLPLTEVSPLFSWLTVGILVGSASALVAFDLLGLRAWLLLLYLLICAALIALRFGDSLWVLRFALGAVGTACGVGLAAAASVISLLYSDDRRASMLVITDGSFSAAGIIISSAAVALVARDAHWSAAYLLVAGAAALIVLLAASAQFPRPALTQTPHSHRALWPLPVWLCVLALFLYTLGQYSLLWWLPTHLQNTLGAGREEAGAVVARFWSGMFVAQILVAWWVLRVGARRLVLLSVGATFLGSLPLWTVTTLDLLPWLAFAWGVANLGLLKIVIAFATLCVERPTPRLVAALLFGATSGTAISPLITTAVVEFGGTGAVLRFGSASYFALAVLVVAAWVLSRNADGSRGGTEE